MPKGQYVASVDVGAFYIRTMIVEHIQGGNSVSRVLGVGEVTSAGLRKGAVIDMEELAKSIGASIEKAESMSGVAVSQVTVNLGGQNTRTQLSKGVIAVGRADGEVTQEDVDRILHSAGEVDIPVNNEIVHVIPRTYRLDDQTGIKNPIGMKGVRLEVEAMIVEGFAPQIKNFLQCFHFAGLDVQQFVFSPLAAAESVLDRKQKELGVVLLDIGVLGTGVVVFEENDILHTTIIPIGAGHITNDIAIGIRTSIDTAEKVKVEYGVAFADSVNKKEDIDLSNIDSSESGEVSRHHVAEIIEARVEEIFDAVNQELKKIGREGLLPAGVVLVGGGAKLPGIVDLAKRILRLPVTIGYPQGLGGLLDKIDDPSYAVVSGLIQWQKNQDADAGESFFGRFGVSEKWESSVFGFGSAFWNWIKKFLP